MKTASWGYIQQPLLDLERPKEWRGKPAYQGLIIEKGASGYRVCGHIHNSAGEATACASKHIDFLLDAFYGPLTKRDDDEHIRDLRLLGLPDYWGATYPPP